MAVRHPVRAWESGTPGAPLPCHSRAHTTCPAAEEAAGRCGFVQGGRRVTSPGSTPPSPARVLVPALLRPTPLTLPFIGWSSCRSAEEACVTAAVGTTAAVRAAAVGLTRGGGHAGAGRRIALCLAAAVAERAALGEMDQD